MTDVDDLLARMKRAAIDAEYWRRLRALIPADLFDPTAPTFTRAPETASMRLAAMACARQGFDAGRFADVTVCPYPALESARDTFARRAWLLGFAEGRKVTPRPEPRDLVQRPVVIR